MGLHGARGGGDITVFRDTVKGKKFGPPRVNASMKFGLQPSRKGSKRGDGALIVSPERQARKQGG